jgi:hypothetical protein
MATHVFAGCYERFIFGFAVPLASDDVPEVSGARRPWGAPCACARMHAMAAALLTPTPSRIAPGAGAGRAREEVHFRCAQGEAGRLRSTRRACMRAPCAGAHGRCLFCTCRLHACARWHAHAHMHKQARTHTRARKHARAPARTRERSTPSSASHRAARMWRRAAPTTPSTCTTCR